MRHVVVPFRFASFRCVCLAVAFLTFIVAAVSRSTAQPLRVGSNGESNAPQPPSKTASDEFFRDKVLPLLESRCFECHGDGDIEGELRLTSRKSMLIGGESGPGITPGDPDRSLIIQAMRYESFQMPPRNKMPDEEIDILARWIQDGAEWPEEMESKSTAPVAKAEFPLEERIAAHWAWKKIHRPDVPKVRDASWPASPTDHFLLAKLEDAGLTPATDADRRSIIRRLYFDLIGLPPSIEQQDQFFNDPSDTPAAMEKVVDQLLASPQFGERWARHWLDLMRYAETLGHEFDYPLPLAFRYRDYVIRALNADVPYDQFVREHLAGDLTPTPRRHPELGFNESIIATGFWYLCEDKHAPVDVKAEEASRVDNQIDVFGKTFLGLTIACARCHDHKFDAITAADYYALSGFLQSSRRRVEWLDQHGQTDKLVGELKAARSQANQAAMSAIGSIDQATMTDLLAKAMQQDDAPGDASTANSSIAESQVSVSALREHLLNPASKRYSSPLSLLATVAQAPKDSSLETTCQEWTNGRDAARNVTTPDSAVVHGWAQTEKGAPSVIAADFRNGLPPNWRTYGAAFGHLQTSVVRSGDIASVRSSDDSNALLAWSPNGFLPDVEQFSSAALSPQLRGQLHSPEFELTHPEIYVLASGKNARVRLQIDGYVMNEFSELLFGGCRQPIDTDGHFRWIRIAGDVGRYVGHRCHLEFLDENDGWFAVREIRLANHQGEIPPDTHSVCSSNNRLVVADPPTVPALIAQVADVIQGDAGWARLALQLSLFSPEHSQPIEQSRQTWQKLAESSQTGDPVLVMCDGSGEDEYLFIRGNHHNRGPMVSRHLLTALDGGHPISEPLTSGRLELIDRVLSDENPFPSRVMVNRVWQHLFGRGIVPTSDNFGVLGEAPSHPELLDSLADEFRNDGWSIKRLIKRLVMTRAYRMSSLRNDVADEKDPTNQLLHRFNVRRLEGEAIRDSLLMISGRIDLAMYGPPIPVHLTGFMQGRGRPGQSGPLDGAGRRSIYQGVNRNFLNPFMLAFDTPQPATTVGLRNRSNVPAQALMLMNNELVHEQSLVWANRLLKEIPDGGDLLLKRAWRQGFAREPSADELLTITEFAEAAAMEKNVPMENKLKNAAIVAEICHIVLNQKEFIFLD